MSWGSPGLPAPGEGATPHLRGSEDKGREDGGNPAIAEVKDNEPGDALHDDDVGQEQEEEQVVALEQVHVLRSLPQGPEVLGDLGLRSESAGKVSATSHRAQQRRSSPRACRGLAQPWGLCTRPQPPSYVAEKGLDSKACILYSRVLSSTIHHPQKAEQTRDH